MAAHDSILPDGWKSTVGAAVKAHNCDWKTPPKPVDPSQTL
jgi:hypothetical protein